MMSRFFSSLLISALGAMAATPTVRAQDISAPELPDSLQFSERQPVNGVTLSGSDGKSLAFYRPAHDSKNPPPAAVFLTHARRDLVSEARQFTENTSQVIAPEPTGELEGMFTEPAAYWTAWWDKRFDYYGQQVTRLPVLPLNVTDIVKDGDSLDISGISFEVLATPGVTREGVTYLAEIGGKRVGFSGNLILAGGQVPDLYSFQDAIRDAKVGAYHGYGGRFGPWIESLEKLAARKPDILIPSQGPVITDPIGDIAKAIDQVRKIYANYLSTNALHWYFGEERMRTCADKVLGPAAPMESMPLAEHIDLPPWVQHMGTTKLLVSADKTGFVLDVGGPRSLQSLQEALDAGLVKKIEGIWVTHRHNDHTKSVRDAQDAFDCPVYAVKEVAEALSEPGAHFSPGISANAVKRVTTVGDGETMSWKEFDFTFRFFPGQMHDHGGMLVTPRDRSIDPVFFIGDSFSPSGIDDYCLMNRNLMREDNGYLRCFQIVREEIPENTWLVNQHIPHLFRFNAKELDFLENRYRERIEMINAFTPWDDVNYAIDEQWAWLFPYGQEVKRGESFSLRLRIINHSQKERNFSARIHFPEGIESAGQPSTEVSIGARGEGSLAIDGTVSDSAPTGVTVITVSLKSEGLNLPHWCEALVKVVD